MPAKDASSQPTHNDERPPGQRPFRPWRTEGLPAARPPKQRPRWIGWAIWFLGYLIFFGLLTLQDRMGGPRSIPYTEFKAQVAKKNVNEVFARSDIIEGTLRKPAPVPRESTGNGRQQQGTYQNFTTERPTFARDDLLSELTASGATVRATPLVQQRDLSRTC